MRVFGAKQLHPQPIGQRLQQQPRGSGAKQHPITAFLVPMQSLQGFRIDLGLQLIEQPIRSPGGLCTVDRFADTKSGNDLLLEPPCSEQPQLPADQPRQTGQTATTWLQGPFAWRAADQRQSPRSNVPSTSKTATRCLPCDVINWRGPTHRSPLL